MQPEMNRKSSSAGNWRRARARLVRARRAPNRAERETAHPAHLAPCAPSHAEREQLILEHLPLVRCIAKRIRERLPGCVLLDDLIDSGVVGLIEAIQRYDPGKHVDLSVYARHRVRGAILDSLRDLDWGSRLLRKKSRDLDQARERVQARTGRPAEDEDLAQEAGMSVDALRRLQESLLRLNHSILHEQTMDEESGDSIEQQPCKQDFDPFRLCLRGELQELLGEAIGSLPERERRILKGYYYDEMTMKEISRGLGVSEARVSQLHSAALGRLRMRSAEAWRGESGIASETALSMIPLESNM